MYGQIAAANSLSDVYAMGGEPVLALNIVGFPNCLSPDILSEIMRGGADKVKEAGALLVGGHSIEDKEPKYGLAVFGLVHPDKVLANAGAKPGDVLILTKPVGTGILNTAIKADLASEAEIAEAMMVMATLNKDAAKVMKQFDVNGCTDITGFGLAGHAYEMAAGSKCTVVLESKTIPMVMGAKDYAQMGIIPAGTYRNRDYISGKYIAFEHVEEWVMDVLFDPQTSGGLLITLPGDQAEAMMTELGNVLKTPFAVIGRIEAAREHALVIE